MHIEVHRWDGHCLESGQTEARRRLLTQWEIGKSSHAHFVPCASTGDPGKINKRIRGGVVGGALGGRGPSPGPWLDGGPHMDPPLLRQRGQVAGTLQAHGVPLFLAGAREGGKARQLGGACQRTKAAALHRGLVCFPFPRGDGCRTGMTSFLPQVP